MQPAPDEADGGMSRQVRRYGPLAVIVVVLVAIGALVLGSSNSGDGSSSTTTIQQTASKAGAPAPTARMPLTYAEAKKQGKAESLDWGQRCDTSKGTTKLPSVYAPPCVPVFKGDNGGATSGGVTGDTIKIVRYQAQEGSDLTSILSSVGVEETPKDQHDTLVDYVRLYDSNAETYGRKIEVVDYQGTGAMDDEVASRSDAKQIIETQKPFAVIGAPALDGGAFAEELAQAHVLCIGELAAGRGSGEA